MATLSIPNTTNIPAPRVPFVDGRTGLISREWYRFLLNLFTLTGSGQNSTPIDDLLVGPPTAGHEFDFQSAELSQMDRTDIAETLKQLEALGIAPIGVESKLFEMEKTLEALTFAPPPEVHVSSATFLAWSAPAVKTGDFIVAAGEVWLINNKAGSTCTVTLPTAVSNLGRSLTFKNLQAQLLVSASSNVAPIDSATPGTGILLAVTGNWATMVSDGANWVIMQQAPNNILLLE